MNILFVQSNTNKMLMPLPIGPSMVAGHLRREGHAVRFLDLMGEKRPLAAARAAVAEHRPDLICLSVRNRDNQAIDGYIDPMPAIRAAIDAMRERCAAPLLIGGTGFTTFPEQTLSRLGADYGIAGDALGPIARFVRSLENGKPDFTTPGLVYRAPDGTLIRNPFTLEGYRNISIDYHADVAPARYRRCYWQAAVITRTGCPEKCAYCDTFRTFGREFVLRDPEEVAGEVLRHKRSGKVRSVWMVDAGFNRPLEHAKRILEEIIRLGAQLRLYGVYDPGPADAEFFSLFRRAGGFGFTVFAESLSDRVLEGLGKSFRAAEIFRDAEMMRKEDILSMYMPTLGGPGETAATVDETIRLTGRLRAAFSWFGFGWRIMPETPLRNRAIEEGMLPADDDCWEARYYISPETPIPLLRRKARRAKLLFGHPHVGELPRIARAIARKPWRRG